MTEAIIRWENTATIGWEDTDAIGWEEQALDLTNRALDTAWLFEVDTYYWSTQAITVNGQAYDAAVDPAAFDGVKISRAYNGADRIHVLEDLTIEIPDESGSYSSADFLGENLDLMAWIDDGTTSGIVRKFLYTVKSAKKVYNVLYLTLQDRFAYDDLEDLYPNNELVQDTWASDGDSNLGYCMPVPFGTPFIPLPSVYITDQRYYVLGKTDGTYTIIRTRSPESWPKSVWNSTEATLSSPYTFPQSTKDTYRVFQAIIADGDEDGTPDSNGLFRDGNTFEPISTQYNRSDTSGTTNPVDIIIDLIFAGSTVPVASGTYGLSPRFEGAFTYNRPAYEWASEFLKASHAALFINNLTGAREVRQLTAQPKAVLDSSNIVSDSFAYDPVADPDPYDGGYIQFPKAGEPQTKLYKYKVGLGDVASSNPTNDTLNLRYVDDTEEAQKLGILYFERKIDKQADINCEAWTSFINRNPDEVIKVSGDLYEGSTAYNVVIQSVKITSDMLVQLDCEQFGHDLSNFSDLSPSALAIVEDDSTGTWTPVIVGPDGEDSLGNITNALVSHLRIRPGGTLIAGSLDSDRVEISDSAITGISDSLGTTFELPTDGSAPTFASGYVKEVEFQMYTSGVIQTNSAPATNGGLLINSTSLRGFNSSGTKLIELVYDGAAEGDVYFGDFDNDNPGIKYDHSDAKLEIRVGSEHGIRVDSGGDVYMINDGVNPGKLIFEPCSEQFGAQLWYDDDT